MKLSLVILKIASIRRFLAYKCRMVQASQSLLALILRVKETFDNCNF